MLRMQIEINETVAIGKSGTAVKNPEETSEILQQFLFSLGAMGRWRSPRPIASLGGENQAVFYKTGEIGRTVKRCDTRQMRRGPDGEG